ncbi:MAG: complex I NDUFA9 subunit family protein [Gammaproteobacteria bacterium]
MRVVLFGGAGFIGRHLAAELAGAGHSITVITRDRESAKRDLILLPNTDVIAADYNAPNAAYRALAGADSAVNLIGILHERRRGAFERTHCEMPRLLADACAAAGVRRFVQLSALGASLSAPSGYLRSRAKGEQIARDKPGVSGTIIRLPVVFGEGDSFINLFAALARHLPFLFLPCARAVMQPVAVGDVSAFVRRILEGGDYDGRVLSAGGPEVFTLAEIVGAVADAIGKPRPVIPLGNSSSRLVGHLADWLPFVHPPISADNCLSAMVPGVCPRGGNDAAKLLGDLTSLRAGLAAMFG